GIRVRHPPPLLAGAAPPPPLLDAETAGPVGQAHLQDPAGLRGGARPTLAGVHTRPVLVLGRHAGPGDSLLPMDGIANRAHRHPRIVLKEFLQWDPAIDVMLNRISSVFVPASGGSEELLAAIRDMAATMNADDAFVIFPEGGNYTPGRHRRSIEKL